MIDFVQFKNEIQKIALVVIGLIVVWNPLYMLVLLIIGMLVKNHAIYKKYYMIFLIVAIISYAVALGICEEEYLIPTTLVSYLMPLPPIRMLCSLVTALFCAYFDFGTVDKWMIADERRKQKEIYSPNQKLTFDNRSHVFAAGTTGSGKTQLLERYIRDSLEKREPLYIVSGKGSGDKQSLLDDVRDMAAKYQRKLYVVSMNPQQTDRVPYNPFKYCTIVEIADALCNASEFSEPHYQQHLSCWIKVVCECMKLANVGFCLDSVITFMDFNNFSMLVDRLVMDKKISNEQATKYRSYEDIAKVASTSRARFINILLGEGKEVIGDINSICAADVREEGAILYLDLDSFAYTDFTKIIGAFFINDMRNIVSTEKSDAPKRIVMDELSTYVTSQIMPLFSQSRSFGYQMVVATQSIADLDEISPVFAERIMENCGQYGILQLNSANDAERISLIIGTVMTVETTRKSTGVQLHYSADGSKKVVNAFKVTPDNIKELKPLEVLFYDKKKPDKVKMIHMTYGWQNV